MLIEKADVKNFLDNLQHYAPRQTLPDAQNIFALFAQALQEAPDPAKGKQIMDDLHTFVDLANKYSQSTHYQTPKEKMDEIWKSKFGIEGALIATSSAERRVEKRSLDLSVEEQEKYARTETEVIPYTIDLSCFQPEHFSLYEKYASHGADFVLTLNVPNESLDYAAQSEKIRQQVNTFNWLAPLLIEKNAHIHLKLTSWNSEDLKNLQYVNALSSLELDVPSWSTLKPVNERIEQILDKLIPPSGVNTKLEKLSIITRLIEIEGFGFFKRVLAKWGDENLEAKLLVLANFPQLKTLHLENYSRPLEGIFKQVENATILSAGLYLLQKMPNYAQAFPNAKNLVISSSLEKVKPSGALGKCLVHPRLETLTICDWRPPNHLQNADLATHNQGKVAFPVFELENCMVGPHLKTIFFKAMEPLYLDGKTIPFKEIFSFIDQHGQFQIRVDSLRESQRKEIEKSLGLLSQEAKERIEITNHAESFDLIFHSKPKEEDSHDRR